MTESKEIRVIDAASEEEIRLVATRMRQTLVEVLGEERGGSMYTMDWLMDRVRWHLDPAQVTGQVFVVEDANGRIVGHTIVRVGEDGEGNDIGLFSTTYVQPESRRSGVAKKLLRCGETWMIEQGMTQAVTYTDKDNAKLQELYIGAGYTMSPMPSDFVKLGRTLP